MTLAKRYGRVRPPDITTTHRITMPANRFRFMTGVAIIGLLIAVILFVSGPYRHDSTGFDITALSSVERAQLSGIILTVSEAPEEILTEARAEVWKILSKHGRPSLSTHEELEQLFIRIGEGTQLFWLDAQRALAERQPVKSGARTQWEADLLSDGWLTFEQQRRYDDFMAQIAREEPIESTHGIDIVINEAIVDDIIQSWDNNELRRAMALLLTPP